MDSKVSAGLNGGGDGRQWQTAGRKTTMPDEEEVEEGKRRELESAVACRDGVCLIIGGRSPGLDAGVQETGQQSSNAGTLDLKRLGIWANKQKT